MGKKTMTDVGTSKEASKLPVKKEVKSQAAVRQQVQCGPMLCLFRTIIGTDCRMPVSPAGDCVVHQF